MSELYKACSECKNASSLDADTCVRCGHRYAEPRTKDRKTGGTAIGSLIFLAAGWWYFFGGGSAMLMPNSATQNGNPSSPSLFAPASRQVSYKVSGSASAASLTYEDPQGGTSQLKVSLPWQVDLTFKDGDYTYISAQNEGDSGSVTTEILIDGVPWKKTSSSGGYTIANCSGSVASP